MTDRTSDRTVMFFAFLFALAALLIGIGCVLKPFLTYSQITRSQIAGIMLIAGSVFTSRWLQSGRHR